MNTNANLNWRETPLGEIATFRNGINYTKDNFGFGVMVINVRDFGDKSFPDYDSLDEINPEGVVRQNDLLENGDILFVRSNGNRQLIGRSIFIDNVRDRITHSAFTIRVRFDLEQAEPRFYAYLFRSSLIRQVLSAYGGGTNISNLNQQILTKLVVPLPPLPAQRKIADILSAYDDLIENNTRRIRLLGQMAQAVYREWFVHYRFPGHEGVKVVDGLPEGWEMVAVKDVSSYINRGISPKYNDNSPSIVINQKCIRDERLNLALARNHTTKATSEKYVRFGDALVNSTGIGTLGRVAQVYQDIPDCTVDSHVSIVRPNERVSMDYFGLYLLTLQPLFDSLGTGSTGQTELARETIAKAEFVLPPKSLQDKFAEVVSPLRKQVIVLTAKNANLRRTRDLLLPRLVGGELVIHNIPYDN